MTVAIEHLPARATAHHNSCTKCGKWGNMLWKIIANNLSSHACIDGDEELTMCGISGLLAVIGVIAQRIEAAMNGWMDRQIDKLSLSCFVAPKSLLFNFSLSYEGTVKF